MTAPAVTAVTAVVRSRLPNECHRARPARSHDQAHFLRHVQVVERFLERLTSRRRAASMRVITPVASVADRECGRIDPDARYAAPAAMSMSMSTSSLTTSEHRGRAMRSTGSVDDVDIDAKFGHEVMTGRTAAR